jgi:hypothetical protein
MERKRRQQPLHKVTQGNILLIEIYADDIVLEVLMTG